jgi:hypothetical protein
MSASKVASKLAADINDLDHSYWLKVGQGRITVGEYFRQRRRLAKMYTRTVGFLHAA